MLNQDAEIDLFTNCFNFDNQRHILYYCTMVRNAAAAAAATGGGGSLAKKAIVNDGHRRHHVPHGHMELLHRTRIENRKGQGEGG